MATTFKFYHDANLTQEVTAGNPITATQDVDNTIAPVQKQVWFGSNTAGRKLRALSNPGVAQLVLDIVDSAGGTGEPDTMMKLATTQGGLATATPGASLNMGTQVLSGVANAVSFWMELNDATATVGVYTDVYPQFNEVIEENV